MTTMSNLLNEIKNVTNLEQIKIELNKYKDFLLFKKPPELKYEEEEFELVLTLQKKSKK